METKFKTGFQKEIFNYRYRIIADKIASPKNDRCVIISKPWCRFKFWESLQIIVKASIGKVNTIDTKIMFKILVIVI